MARKSFAYNLDHSPISLLPSNDVKSKIVSKAMAQVSFKSVYFEFDGDQHKPYMVMDGEVEAYSVLKNSKEDFFDGVKRVIFAPENRPTARFRYDFNENQVAVIAKAGWFERGSETPPEFLSSSFALITDNIQVDILNPKHKNGEAPILKVGPCENHMYNFDIKDYDLTDFIVDNIRLKQDEFTVVSEAAHDEHATKAEESIKTRSESAIRAPEMLTAQQARIRNAAKAALAAVDKIWEDIDEYRAEHNEIYAREKEAQKAAKDTDSVAQKRDDIAEKQAISRNDENRLNDFLGQFKDVPDKNTETVNSDSEIVIKTRDTAEKPQNINSSEEIKERNEKAVAENRKDDAAQAVQAEIVEKTEIAESIKPDDKDDNDTTDRIEQDIAALSENDNPWAKFMGNKNDSNAENIKERNEEAISENRKDDAAQAVQADIVAEKSAENRYASNVLKVDVATADEKDKDRGGRFG